MSCRCSALREVFGARAPEQCMLCLEATLRASYVARDWVEIARTGVTAYRDCGVPCETSTYPPLAMVPRWADELVKALAGTYALSVVLLRASQDEEFRLAVEAILRTASGSVVEAVCEFAEGQGLATDGSVVARNGRAVFPHAEQELAPWPVPQAPFAQGW